ncbi:hypothetical protein HMPREF1624_05135 [Sporothrix schenckii ATCC 58251]|uniref:MEI5 protein n=1 Tax=Sporothrix schenckii (strain ATCC 58251 / de Perez 2211183) TaxID=1391915 RepID=U7PTS0_SPOS1|nr:hypothetical protein HMPREF1624_05135 [Sporothrix schenckii ATCC 58251]
MVADIGPNADPTDVVDGLVGAIKTIAADPNYNLLANIFSEVLHLRAKNAELVSTNRNVFEQYWDFRRELEDGQARLEAAKSLVEAELAGKAQELTDMTEARDKLDTTLQTTAAELADTTGAKKQLEADLATANTKLDSLKTFKASLENELSQVTAKLEEQKHLSDVAAQENAALQVSLAQRETELEKTKSDLGATNSNLQELTKERDSLKESLCHTEADLVAKTARLAALDSYRVVLRNQPEDVYVTILDTIWTRLFHLVEEHFRQDLEDKVLSDPSCWKNLRTAEALKGPTQIPLPQSNSPVAKAMRIAAVLSILSRTLHKHIFRPIYLIEDDAELTRVLHGVEFESPEREEHIRATLLATLPDVQRHSAKARVQHVVREVSWVVQHLLGALPYDAFCSGLGSACALACTEWQKIQTARMKIEPYFGPPYDEFDWQALPLPEFEGRTGSPQTGSGANSARDGSPARAEDTPIITIEGDDAAAVELDGTAVGADADATTEGNAPVGEDAPPTAEDKAEGGPAEGNTDAGDNTDAAADDTAVANSSDNDTAIADDEDDDDDEMDPSDILLVVWPSMAVVENGDHQPITQGLVVTKAQAALAFQEVYAARNTGNGAGLNSKRARTMSIPSSMPKPALANSRDALSAGNSPLPKKSFLAVAGGGEEAVSSAG